MKILLRVILLCIAVLHFGVAPLHAESQVVPNYQGLWWKDPPGSESGWGVNFAHQGDIVFATWFTYDEDRAPLWFAAELRKVSPGVYSGNLITLTGPPFNAVPFDPGTLVESTAGTMNVTFADASHATMTYTVGTVSQSKAIVRQEFGPLPTCVWGELADLSKAVNYTDLWWRSPAGSEAGWGISFTHQGDVIFATWFTYDANREPWWLIAELHRTGDGLYQGLVYTVSGPAFSSVPFDPGTVAASVVGTASVAFANGNRATFSYVVNGIAQAKPIERQVFVPPGTACRSSADPVAPFDVKLAADSVLLLPGATREVDVIVSPRNGSAGAVALAATGLPSGVAHQFEPASVAVGPGAVGAVLRLTAAAGAAATETAAAVAVTGQDGAAGATAELAVRIAVAGDPIALKLDAIAAVERRFQDLRGEGLSRTAVLQGVASFMAGHPAYKAAGVDLEIFNAWGRFHDGTGHIVALNRDAEPAELAAVGAKRTPGLKAAAELPAVTKARVLHSFGSGFSGQSPVNQIKGYLQSRGWSLRAGAEGDAHVGILKGVSGDGFFYLNTHGGRIEVDDPSETDGKMYAVQSSTVVDDDYQRVFADDLTARRLVHFTAENGEEYRNWRGATVRRTDTRYAITYRFVDKYMNFTNESVVWMNACWSGRNAEFVNAFIRKGAGVYLGWSELLSATAAFRSAPYFVDRMVGANQHPDKESPPQRPFAYNLVLFDMAKNGLDKDPANNGQLQATVKSGLKHPPIFAPSIRHVEVNEYDEELHLIGQFGDDKPKVTVGGAELTVKTWKADELVVALPLTGPGSSGDVVVTVRGVRSNARQLSEWLLPVTYAWFNIGDEPGLRIDGSGPLRWRADVGGYRTLPGEPLEYALRGGAPTRDSGLTLTASGSRSDGSCTSTLSGTGNYVSPASPAAAQGPVLASAFKLDGETRLGAVGMAFGAFEIPHRLTISGSGCIGSFPFAPTMALLEGQINFPQGGGFPAVPLTGLTFMVNSDYRIPARTFETNEASGTLRVSWTPAATSDPPRNTDDAGK